jgi:16S rRNA (cytosine967-C5)-methyltransferase
MHKRSGKHQVSPSRRVAFDILRRVEAEGAYASALLAPLAHTGLSREDRALAQEITLGVLRWQKQLDYFIHRYSRREVGGLDLSVLLALRVGLYQIRHLARIPQSAAVNESVNLVKRNGAASAAGLVNAVLRNAIRHKGDKPGDTISDPVESMAVEVSHPRWMIERWRVGLGEEQSRHLALANNHPPPVAFRLNTLRAGVEETLSSLESKGVTLLPSRFVPGAFRVESGPMAVIAEAAENGAIYIQDEASQLVSLLLGPTAGDRVLDLCAAPGSKTSHIATLAGDAGWVVACDIHPHRLVALAATCRRLGVSSVDPIALDATRELPILEGAGKFDRVLVDAPCTGTGTLRRNPEIKWRLAVGDPRRLAALQLSLLKRAADALANKGRLVYSTCSVEPEENEEVVRRFIESDRRFRIARPLAPGELITGDGFVRTFPHRHEMDGFFAAVLEKIEE